jgi:hypothetical protein
MLALPLPFVSSPLVSLSIYTTIAIATTVMITTYAIFALTCIHPDLLALLLSSCPTALRALCDTTRFVSHVNITKFKPKLTFKSQPTPLTSIYLPSPAPYSLFTLSPAHATARAGQP